MCENSLFLSIFQSHRSIKMLADSRRKIQHFCPGMLCIFMENMEIHQRTNTTKTFLKNSKVLKKSSISPHRYVFFYANKILLLALFWNVCPFHEWLTTMLCVVLLLWDASVVSTHVRMKFISFFFPLIHSLSIIIVVSPMMNIRPYTKGVAGMCRGGKKLNQTSSRRTGEWECR